MYLPFDQELQKIHDKDKRRLRELERKYPKAKTDSFQKSCMTWEFLYGGKALWMIDCPNRDVQKTMDTFNKMFDIFTGFKAGLATSAVADKPDGHAIGIQVLCYETAKDTIKAKLKSLGVEDTEMHWLPEAELRRQFEDWRKQQRRHHKFAKSPTKTTAIKDEVASDVGISELGNLFRLIVDEDKAHPDFIALRDSVHHVGARKLMNELYLRMGDPNGNFLSDFQSNSYHSRLFEIACYGYLESHGFAINRTFPSPDFLVSSGNDRVAVEAVTANPSSGLAGDISAVGINPLLPFEDLYDKSTNEFPIRMGDALLKKLQKKYWLLPHCQNIPLVLIISPFYEPGSIFYIDDALARYLYGGWDVFPDWVKYNGLLTRAIPIMSYQYGEKSLTTNYFSQPMSEHVSAVIYSNSFTECKFVRMAIQMGLESKVEATRIGTCLLPREDGDLLARDFEYRVADKTAPIETWFQGLTIFHNPKALIPLPEDFFKSTNIYQVRNGRLNRRVNDFHPLVSFTIINPV